MSRFLIQPAEADNSWVCTDTTNGIVCVFEEHMFNDTQDFTVLEDMKASPNDYARFAREMGDWLRENHYEKIF